MPSEARALLGTLQSVLRTMPEDVRSDAFDSIVNATGETRDGLRTVLPRLLPHLKTIIAFLVRTDRIDDLDESMETLAELEVVWKDAQRRTTPQTETESALLVPSEGQVNADVAVIDRAEEAISRDERVIWLLTEAQRVQQERTAANRNPWFSLHLTSRLCAQLAPGDFAQFRCGFRAVARVDIEDAANVERGLGLLHRYPTLRVLLSEILTEWPGRGLKLLSRLGQTSHFGAAALAPLEPWRNPASTLAPHELPAEWQDLLGLAPELSSLAADYLWAQRVSAASQAVPASVRRALELPRKLAGELDHLEHLPATTSDLTLQSRFTQRVATLRLRLADHAQLREQAVAEARDKLQSLAREARLNAGESSVASCFRAQLQALVGRLPHELVMSDDWFNAVLLSVNISHNRKLLRHLLRAQARGDLEWRARQPANIAFLRGLAARGVNVESWQGEHRKRYALSEVAGGCVHLRVEHDPLQIFQMGNAFGTCLSVGDINAFSTVANACEANKRIIFARDGMGRIVARKLLAINAGGALVGFYTYVSGSNETVNAALRGIMARYAREFAARCGLTLADKGEVPLLLAEQWYNDGLVPWSDTEAKPPHSKPLEGRNSPNGVANCDDHASIVDV